MAPVSASGRSRGRPRVTHEKAEARKQALIRAAHEAFSDEGYRSTTVTDIAARAGLAVGAYYKAFSSKREILDPALDYGTKQLLDEVLRGDLLTTVTTFAELQQQFRSISARIDTALATRPHLAKFIVFEIGSIDDDIRQRWREVIDLIVALVSGYLEQGRDAGFLRADLDVEETALVLIGAIHMAITQVAYGSKQPGQLDSYMDATNALIGFGIKAPEATDHESHVKSQ